MLLQVVLNSARPAIAATTASCALMATTTVTMTSVEVSPCLGPGILAGIVTSTGSVLDLNYKTEKGLSEPMLSTLIMRNPPHMYID